MKTSSQRKTGDACACRRSSPASATPVGVSNRPPRPARPSPRPAAGGRGTCSGSRRGSAAPLTWALRRWRRSAAGRRRRGRGGAPGLRAALGRPREAERPRLGRSCAPRAPATAPRRRPQSLLDRSFVANQQSGCLLPRCLQTGLCRWFSATRSRRGIALIRACLALRSRRPQGRRGWSGAPLGPPLIESCNRSAIVAGRTFSCTPADMNLEHAPNPRGEAVAQGVLRRSTFA